MDLCLLQLPGPLCQLPQDAGRGVSALQDHPCTRSKLECALIQEQGRVCINTATSALRRHVSTLNRVHFSSLLCRSESNLLYFIIFCLTEVTYSQCQTPFYYACHAQYQWGCYTLHRWHYQPCIWLRHNFPDSDWVWQISTCIHYEITSYFRTLHHWVWILHKTEWPWTV